MRGKVAKELRRAMKSNGLDVMGPAQLEQINKKVRLVYERNANGKLVPVKVIRAQIINKTKLGYRRLKRDYKAGVFNK